MLKFTNEQRERFRKRELATDAKNQYIQSSKFKSWKANEDYDKEASDNLANLLYNTFEKINSKADNEVAINRNRSAYTNSMRETLPIDPSIIKESEAMQKARALARLNRANRKAKLNELRHTKTQNEINERKARTAMNAEDNASRRFNTEHNTRERIAREVADELVDVVEMADNYRVQHEAKNAAKREQALLNLQKARAANIIKNAFRKNNAVKGNVKFIIDETEKRIHENEVMRKAKELIAKKPLRNRKNSKGPMRYSEIDAVPPHDSDEEKPNELIESYNDFNMTPPRLDPTPPKQNIKLSMSLENINKKIEEKYPKYFASKEYQEYQQLINGKKLEKKALKSSLVNSVSVWHKRKAQELSINEGRKKKNKHFTNARVLKFNTSK